MNKKIIVVIVVLIALLGFVIFRQNNTNPKTVDTGTSAPLESINPNAPISTYTLEDVSKHNNKADCWTAVNDGVYNVTSWIEEHPGGASAIISLCGTDGSAAFDGQHGGQKRPASELASFKIGDLKN